MIDVEHHRAHLGGEKPDELPLQAPTKFQLVVNVKAAKETGLENTGDGFGPSRPGCLNESLRCDASGRKWQL
jgi:hypothetical protein